VTWRALSASHYAVAGVKSTALLFGDYPKTALAGFGGVSTAALCASGRFLHSATSQLNLSRFCLEIFNHLAHPAVSAYFDPRHGGV
jgi:4-hydroxybenzoate polyprenyltransferase